jgi:hypothetical protein
VKTNSFGSWSFEQAAAQEVYPPLRRNLERLGFAGVPESARTQLHKLSKINAVRNAL